jgi:hypothetical protein
MVRNDNTESNEKCSGECGQEIVVQAVCEYADGSSQRSDEENPDLGRHQYEDSND